MPGEFRELPLHLQQVARLVAIGATNEEIAARRRLRLHTVENYVSEIMDLTSCHPRSKLIVSALRWCEVEPNSRTAR